jgi:hypothetical protein
MLAKQIVAPSLLSQAQLGRSVQQQLPRVRQSHHQYKAYITLLEIQWLSPFMPALLLYTIFLFRLVYLIT